jgi:hypothetical protein
MIEVAIRPSFKVDLNRRRLAVNSKEPKDPLLFSTCRSPISRTTKAVLISMKTSQKRKRDRRRSSDRTPPLYATERKF